ncbi:hypothetical protein IGI04_013878 [Brassica rapa subsp. trilocularis]|uniref:Ferulate-5-hydroxylase n=1 Tax=Brassica rapa subsp. trilocularis TaxID=1813537 RepID=A0ABQ7NDB4_BRACM|nr:hypothetical protein IGI04_013878 [Brassica rapa subsp. trilocularis]
MESSVSQTLSQVLDPTTAILIIVSLFIFIGVITRRRRSYPPGPRGWPIIGNMLMMDQLTHRGLANLAKKYGGLCHLRMGFLHMYAVSSPDVARQVLQVQDSIFSNRPATIAISYLTYDRADMAFAHYGPFWRQMRKVCVMKVFSRKRAESWASVRDEVDKMIRSVSSNVGKSINVGEQIFALTRNITYRAAFGSACEKGQDEFIRILQEFSKLFGAFNVADFIPYFGWIDPQGISKRLVKARNDLDGFIDDIIDEHMKKKENQNTVDDGDVGDTDMVDDLLAFYSEEAKLVSETTDLQNSIKLTRDNIKAIIMDVMFGGTETDTEIDGYFVPKKSRVMINAFAIGRDPKSWPDAETFRPSRFLEPGVADFKGSNFEFIPFGSGRRSCPGMQLGLYALELAVAHILHCFTWKLPDGMKASELDMNDVFGLTAPKATRLFAVPSTRLICAV